MFLLFFSIGVFISYKTITTTFKKSNKEQLITELPNIVLDKIIQVS